MEEFIVCFSEFSDPRQENVRHNLYEVLRIALALGGPRRTGERG
jgi:hypothetical protein